MIRRCVIGLALVLAGCSGAQAPAPAPAAAPVPSQNQEFTQQQAEALSPDRLQSLWWSWVGSGQPGPLADTTGEFCGDSQPFGVWLVAGSTGAPVDRHCQVPSSLPVAGAVLAEMTGDAASCTAFLARAKGEALLDGQPQPVERVEPARVTYDSGQGPKEGFGCGLWVRLQPLSPGEHTLTLRGSSGTTTSEANYNLTVVRLP